MSHAARESKRGAKGVTRRGEMDVNVEDRRASPREAIER